MVSNKAASWRSNSATTPAKEELLQLVATLSEYECRQLLSSVGAIAQGERFWEGDFGLLYDQFVKLRFMRLGRAAPAPPSAETGAFVPIPMAKAYPAARRLPLPPPGDLSMALGDAVLRRRSRRDYRADGVSAEQLSTLLRYAAGATGFVPAYQYTRLPLRTFPSHGGLQAPELYLAIRAVGDVPTGLYHYAPVEHALDLLRPDDLSGRLRELTFEERHVERAAVVVLCTGCYERLRWKYGERAYRFMCLDAGFVGQNLYLVAEALGLGACAVSGFAQDGVEELLTIDGKSELALFLLTVGVRDAPAA